jgi:hypothetical protein
VPGVATISPSRHEDAVDAAEEGVRQIGPLTPRAADAKREQTGGGDDLIRHARAEVTHHRPIAVLPSRKLGVSDASRSLRKDRQLPFWTSGHPDPTPR